jgi:hypothetical protein
MVFLILRKKSNTTKMKTKINLYWDVIYIYMKLNEMVNDDNFIYNFQIYYFLFILFYFILSIFSYNDVRRLTLFCKCILMLAKLIEN